MTATLACPKPAETPLQEAAAVAAVTAPRRRGARRREGAGRGRRAVLTRLALSAFLHAILFGALALWAIDRQPPIRGRGISLQVVHTPDLVAETLEADEDLEVPELEEIPVLAAFEPAHEAPLEEEPLEDDEAFLPALDAGPSEADVAMNDLSVSVVRARTRREVQAPPVPRTRPPPLHVVPVVARPATRMPARPPQPRRASGGAPRGRLVPLHMPRIYPEGARRMGLQGRAVVLVTIGAGGRIVHAELVTSAGHPALDEAALTSARAWRFQAPGETRRLRLPFNYQLR